MAKFRYVAVGPDGTRVKAATQAASANALRNELTFREFEVVKIREKKAFSDIEVTRQRVPPQVVMHFSRQMAAFVRSGIPITDALAVVEEGAENKRFKQILADMIEALHSGVPFSEALAVHAVVFPPYYVSILRSAEHTGRLDSVLDQLADYMERDLEASHKLRSALTYPIIIAFMSIGVVVLLATYVLPRLTGIFEEFEAELPLTTRMLLSIADFFKHYWYVAPLVAALIVVAVVLLRVTKRGRRLRDGALLKMWLLGEIVRYAAVERFCRILGSMMSAGVPMPDAMRAAIDSSNNTVFEQKLEVVNESMLEGEGMAGPIGGAGLFPRAATQMIRVGEETGTLDAQLENAAAYYGSELEYKLKRLTTMFEPAVIVFMGVIVGFVAVAMVQAMYGVLQSSHLK